MGTSAACAATPHVGGGAEGGEGRAPQEEEGSGMGTSAAGVVTPHVEGGAGAATPNVAGVGAATAKAPRTCLTRVHISLLRTVPYPLRGYRRFSS